MGNVLCVSLLFYYTHPQQENKTLPLNIHEQLQRKQNGMTHNFEWFIVSPRFTTWRHS
jgi:hypothetical protein